MLTWATGIETWRGAQRASPARGFTLIELLVVVVILAVLAGALTLSIGSLGGERQLEQQARRAQALIAHACEQAQLLDRDIGVAFDLSGYRFARRDGERWQVVRSDELRPRRWLSGTRAAVSIDDHPLAVGVEFPERPQLVCFASGDLTPFRLELRLTDLAVAWRLDGTPTGDVGVVAVQADAR